MAEAADTGATADTAVRPTDRAASEEEVDGEEEKKDEGEYEREEGDGQQEQEQLVAAGVVGVGGIISLELNQLLWSSSSGDSPSPRL